MKKSLVENCISWLHNRNKVIIFNDIRPISLIMYFYTYNLWSTSCGAFYIGDGYGSKTWGCFESCGYGWRRWGDVLGTTCYVLHAQNSNMENAQDMWWVRVTSHEVKPLRHARIIFEQKRVLWSGHHTSWVGCGNFLVGSLWQASDRLLVDLLYKIWGFLLLVIF